MNLKKTNIYDDFLHNLSGTSFQVSPPFKISRILFIFFSYEFLAVLFFRLYSSLYRYRVTKIFSIILYSIYKYIFKVDIHPKAKIGNGLLLVHGFNIVIGPEAIIGNFVCIFDGVSIGKKNVGTNDGMPVIGDNVIIGSGAKLLGEIRIASQTIIGANSVVIKSILKEGCTVAGIPAKVLRNG